MLLLTFSITSCCVQQCPGSCEGVGCHICEERCPINCPATVGGSQAGPRVREASAGSQDEHL